LPPKIDYLTGPTAEETKKLRQYNVEKRTPQILHTKAPAFPSLPVRKAPFFKLIQQGPVLKDRKSVV
jgi:hypothetical protein